MDIQPTNQQPISDDQELAKVLAGVTQQADEAATATPAPTNPPVAEPVQEAPEEEAASMPATEPATPAPIMSATPSIPGDLDSIKKDALSELRPLVDKLNVAPEEKFDTYLLLIRSTDDQSLIGPAHEAARSITDEARRAQALLDIIKEIDYLSNPQQPTA
jgi:hypothetical protein